MKITWLGHSCFCLESGGYRIVVDPYRMDSYPPLQTCANAVYCSHGHYDHNYTEAVTMLEEKPSPFTVEEIQTFHDDQGGALRGTNTVHVLAAEGLRVVHLGDLGHELSEAQLAPLRGCDALLIPVGGFYTIDAETAMRVADAIAPRVIVPMHYRHGSHGYDVIATVEDFLRLYPADEVHCLDGSSFELTPDAPRGVIVPRFMG